MFDPISGEFVSFGDDYAAIGYENAEIIGDDISDLFGAAPRAARPQRAQVAQRMAVDRNIDPNAVLVRSQVDTRRRYLDLGIPETSVPAGATALIEIRPQRVIRIEEIIIPEAIADDFVFLSALVGQNSQFAGGAPVPCSTFSTASLRALKRLWDTANPGITIQLTVRNTSAGPLTFRGSLAGTTTVR